MRKRSTTTSGRYPLHPIMGVIRQRFYESGMSQRELATRMMTTQSYVSDLFNESTHEGKNPTLNVILTLCEILDMTLIITRDDKRTPVLRVPFTWNE